MDCVMKNLEGEDQYTTAKERCRELRSSNRGKKLTLK